MRSLLWIMLSIAPVQAQGVDATELLQKAKAFGEATRSWRAEVIETFQVSGPGMNLQSEVRTKIAAQPLLKMSRQNSGDDQTITVCDGTESFYSGDGHSYYRSEAKATPQCDLPLIKFYEPYTSPASVTVVGEDHIRLTDGERRCVVIRTELKIGSANSVRTMCIDPSQGLILRDVIENADQSKGIKSYRAITFVSFENNPTLSPDIFRFAVPPGAVEAKPPI